MGLLSIFKRTGEAPASPVPESGDAVQQARVRARRRLIGATVLLVIGVIGFPLVFETRPRPIPVDIPIEIPGKENAPPLAMPPARTSTPASVPPVPPQSAATEAGVITESPSDAKREIAPREAPKVAAASVKPASEASKAGAAFKSAPVAAGKPTPVPASRPAPASAESGRAQALLESKPSAAAAPGRFVVQVGAFAEAESARETRQKVEKLGLKAYTQVAQTSAGSRIRVRIGPFDTRAEADAALAKARAAGLNPVVLTL